MKNHSELVGGVTLATLERYRQSQNALYPIKRPKAAEHAINARSGFVNGVPMQWMTDWPLPYPLIISQANGASLTDIDGNQYADFCLGDTGAMFGHSPESIALAVQSQAQRGFTHMLPTADAAIVSELLAQTFGLPVWQNHRRIGQYRLSDDAGNISLFQCVAQTVDVIELHNLCHCRQISELAH